jgi:hypothetical protein
VVETVTSRPSLTSRLLDRLTSSAEMAVAGVVLASAASSAQAVVAIPEPTITLEGSVAKGHNSSGWFSHNTIPGTSGGQVAGALDEGFKLYGDISLPASSYMFNTYSPALYDGWGGYSSNATGVALVWWGKAQNLRFATYDYDEEGNWIQLSPGDRLAFNYEFTLAGESGSSVRLEAGFTTQMPNFDAYASEPSFEFSQGRIDEYLDDADGGSATFTGTIQGQVLDQYSLSTFDEVYWVVKLIATQTYDPSSTLRLTVPQNSIDVALNQPPVTSVPEPEAITLVLSGLLATWVLGRRRRC